METKVARISPPRPAAAAAALLLCCAFFILAGAKADLEQKQHFVLVHGIGHGAWCWFKVVDRLRDFYGHRVSTVDLGGAAINRVVPAENITTVAQFTKPVVDLLAGLEPLEKVILVGHSLGGGTAAYASELFPDRISKAVYLAASSPTYGDTYFNSFAPDTFPRLLQAGDLFMNFPDGPGTPAKSVSLNTTRLREFFYNQSPEREVILAQTLLTSSPAGIGEEVLPLSRDRFGTVPRYYIKTLADLGVPPSDQDYVIARNPPLCVFPLPGADHAVFFSRPRQLARLLDHIAGLELQGSCQPVRRKTFALP